MKKIFPWLLFLPLLYGQCTHRVENNGLVLSIGENPVLSDSQLQDQISKVDFLVIDSTEALLSDNRKIIFFASSVVKI